MFRNKELAKRISKLECALEAHIESTENSIRDIDAQSREDSYKVDYGLLVCERATLNGKLDALAGYLGVEVELEKGKDTIKVKKLKKGKK